MGHTCIVAYRPLRIPLRVLALAIVVLAPFRFCDVHAASAVGDLAKAPLTLVRIAFTSTRCTRILTAMKLSQLPDLSSAGSVGSTTISADAITLNTPTNDQPCSWGNLSFDFEGIPTEVTARVTPYTLFLRVVKDIIPPENYLFGTGLVGSCPTSPRNQPSNITMTSLLFFTPENNKTKISTWASNSGPRPEDDTNKLLANGILYAAVAFDLSGVSKEELNEITEGDRGIEVTEFHCFLASDAEAASKAVDEGDDELENDQADNRNATSSNTSRGDPSTSKEKRKLTAGEIVGIAGGFVVAFVTVVTIFAARRKRGRPVDAPRLPRGL